MNFTIWYITTIYSVCIKEDILRINLYDLLLRPTPIQNSEPRAMIFEIYSFLYLLEKKIFQYCTWFPVFIQNPSPMGWGFWISQFMLPFLWRYMYHTLKWLWLAGLFKTKKLKSEKITVKWLKDCIMKTPNKEIQMGHEMKTESNKDPEWLDNTQMLPAYIEMLNVCIWQ